MDITPFLGWIGLGLGVISRIFVPWLQARRQNPEEAQWSWRYIWPQIAGVTIVALLLPLVISDLTAIGGMAFGAAYVVGWGAADMGRFVDKVATKK